MGTMTMNPDAIYPLSGSTVQDKDANGAPYWRSTNYNEGDSFGTLGGHVRMRAAALLARIYPRALVIANTACIDGRQPTHAQVHRRELIELGVPQERIVLEEKSLTTGSEVHEALVLAKQNGWKKILFVSNEYHLPRIKIFYEQAHSGIEAEFASAEEVVGGEDPGFAAYFKAVKNAPEYKKRVLSEARGVESLKKGTYRPALPAEKKERKI